MQTTHELETLRQQLRSQLQPVGALEEEIFTAYTWSLHQVSKFREYEAWAQTQWENDMENEAKFRRLEKITLFRLRHERAAERSLKELGRIQADRFAAHQPNQALAALGHPGKTLSAALPLWQFRRKALSKANPFSLASEQVAAVQTPPEAARQP